MTTDTDVQFGANDVRLSLREWGIASLITAALLCLMPVVWQQAEPLDLGPDYRLPYRLGNDYWMYARISRALCTEGNVAILGDSVVWGHYVSNDQTLSHHLNESVGDGRFVNLGVDGIHPAALDGLMAYYGCAVTKRDVILHCNLLWTSSARQDLQTRKEFAFNHPELVPQFVPGIPCYRQSLSGRLGTVIGRGVPVAGWAKHLRIAYFDGRDMPSWTLDHPYRNPLARLALPLPSPEAPPSPTPVAEPWTEQGFGSFNAAWVDLDTSIQWRSFRRTVHRLRGRGNRLFVVVGPFNEHMLTAESLERYLERKAAVQSWLTENAIPHIIPDVLPSEHFADASHPLNEGYALLAKQFLGSDSFRRFARLPVTPAIPQDQ